MRAHGQSWGVTLGRMKRSRSILTGLGLGLTGVLIGLIAFLYASPPADFYRVSVLLRDNPSRVSEAEWLLVLQANDWYRAVTSPAIPGLILGAIVGLSPLRLTVWHAFISALTFASLESRGDLSLTIVSSRFAVFIVCLAGVNFIVRQLKLEVFRRRPVDSHDENQSGTGALP